MTKAADLSKTGSLVNTDGQLSLTTGVTGILPVANGGTGLTSLTAGYIPFGNGTSAFGSSSSLFWDNTNKRLGVGTTSPQGQLVASNSGAEGLEIDSTAVAGTSRLLAYNRTTSAEIPLQLRGSIQTFLTAATERMRITSSGTIQFIGAGSTGSPAFQMNDVAPAGSFRINDSGSVGIGTTSPNANLHVQGTATVDGSIVFNQQLTSTTAYNSSPQSGSLVSLKYNAGGSYAGMGGWSIAKENATDGNYASYFAIHTRANGGSIAEKARISSAGGFSVGTTADPGAGAIYATGNITAYYSSDRNLKENIKDVDGALSIVSAIGSKTFDWKDDYIASKGGEDGYFVQKSDFGVIAQDVQEVFPQAVRTREDGTLAVDYEKLSTLAFGAIKELLKRVEALEAK